MRKVANIGQLLLDASLDQSQGITFLNRDGNVKQEMTYAAICDAAIKQAYILQKYGLKRGDRVALLYPSGIDFIVGFFACCFCGAIAVPLALPYVHRRYFKKLRYLLENAQAALLLVDESVYSMTQEWLQSNQLPLLCIKAAPIGDANESPRELPEFWGCSRSDVALLQYTSGSTSNPKGVLLTHDNLLHNQEIISTAFQSHLDSCLVGWLPHYHDMGLIGNIIHSVYLGIPMILLSSIDFISKPSLWLETISTYRATLSGGPNFAYEHCIERVSDDMVASLDLSSWELAFNGAEPVRHETIKRFSEKFVTCGFRKQAFYPCYGLAEASLFVTGGKRLVGAKTTEVSSKEADDKIVSSGSPGMNTKVLIVDPETKELLAEGEIGEVVVQSPSVAIGYWQNHKATQDTFHNEFKGVPGHFMRTGDLGCLKGDQLLIVGRLKELVIIAGKNFYPQDIEYEVQATHPEFEGCVGAFFDIVEHGKQKVVLVYELNRAYLKFVEQEFLELVKRVSATIFNIYGIKVNYLLLTKPGAVPRTTSGKIQRVKCREYFMSDALEKVYLNRWD